MNQSKKDVYGSHSFLLIEHGSTIIIFVGYNHVSIQQLCK
jgi:hypothetical protein